MIDNPRIDDLRHRLENDPASIAFAQLAEEYRRAGRIQESIDVCRAGLGRHPAYLSARVTLGRALLELGQLDAARRELDVVVASAPENLAAVRGLAAIHQARGALPEALVFYRTALALARNDPDLERTVADLARQVGPSIRTVPGDVMPPPSVVPLVAAPAVTVEPVPTRAGHRQASDRALRTIAALEQWLDAITANNVARTHPDA
jgi:tetratricopeptide (TPR) repeat protein